MTHPHTPRERERERKTHVIFCVWEDSDVHSHFSLGNVNFVLVVCLCLHILRCWSICNIHHDSSASHRYEYLVRKSGKMLSVDRWWTHLFYSTTLSTFLLFKMIYFLFLSPSLVFFSTLSVCLLLLPSLVSCLVYLEAVSFYLFDSPLYFLFRCCFFFTGSSSIFFPHLRTGIDPG